MDVLLISTGQQIQLQLNNPYQDVWALQGYPGFFMAKDSIVGLPVPPGGESSSNPRMWRVANSKDAQEFEDFFQKWQTPLGAKLYRGIPGCHFCWKRLREESTLYSEGNNDIPMATMGNKAPTMWLPSAWDYGAAEGCAFSCLADAAAPVSTYLKLMDGNIADRNSRFPVGIVVEIPVKLHGAISICWLNPCETVVKGPLKPGQFSLHRIAWLTAQGIEVTPTTFQAKDLFVERPYQPKSQDWFVEWRKKVGNDNWLKQSAVK